MTTITLPPEIEGPLIEAAHKQGITPEQLALDALRNLFGPAGGEETLFDFLRDHIGVLEGSEDSLSEDCGRRFTDALEEKRKRGHL